MDNRELLRRYFRAQAHFQGGARPWRSVRVTVRSRWDAATRRGLEWAVFVQSSDGRAWEREGHYYRTRGLAWSMAVRRFWRVRKVEG